MNNNYFIVENAAIRKGLVSGWLGQMVIFPQAIYFITLIKVSPDDYFTYYGIGVSGAYSRTKKNREVIMKKKDRELIKLGDYIDRIDDIIFERENSLKINKMEIEKCTIPKRYYLQTGSFSSGVIKIKTINRKYEILFEEAKKKIPEIKEYLINNAYLVT